MKTVSLRLLEHRFSSVTVGLFPEQGRGFQTYAASQELIGSEDLRVLEQAAFYSVSRERRERGDLPIKLTFFRLPSGSYALGRTQDAGTDALGREGNYLTQHYVVEATALQSLSFNVFALFDTATWVETNDDRQPRLLTLQEFEVSVPSFDFGAATDIPWPRVADLAAALVSADLSKVLVNTEAPLPLLRGLFAVVEAEKRSRLTFSTHFYRSESLRSLFALATVGSPAEAPSDLASYTHLKSFPDTPTTAYGRWLKDRIHRAAWQEIEALNALLSTLRVEPETITSETREALALAPDSYAVLWELLGRKIIPFLCGSFTQLQFFLAGDGISEETVNSLLKMAVPEDLICTDLSEEEQAAFLQLIERNASPNVWKQWRKQGKSNPLLDRLLSPLPWWRKRR